VTAGRVITEPRAAEARPCPSPKSSRGRRRCPVIGKNSFRVKSRRM
jgi:hypothetical protein